MGLSPWFSRANASPLARLESCRRRGRGSRRSRSGSCFPRSSGCRRRCRRYVSAGRCADRNGGGGPLRADVEFAGQREGADVIGRGLRRGEDIGVILADKVKRRWSDDAEPRRGARGDQMKFRVRRPVAGVAINPHASRRAKNAASRRRAPHPP